MSVAEKIQALKDFDREAEKIVIELCKDRRAMIIKMNVDEMYGGVDAEGADISPPYRPSTIRRKRRRNQPYDRVTLRDEGDFHGSVEIEFRDGEFELVSRDQKAKYLQRKYGDDILGLSEDNVEKLTNDLKDDFQEVFRKIVLG